MAATEDRSDLAGGFLAGSWLAFTVWESMSLIRGMGRSAELPMIGILGGGAAVLAGLLLAAGVTLAFSRNAPAAAQVRSFTVVLWALCAVTLAGGILEHVAIGWAAERRGTTVGLAGLRFARNVLLVSGAGLGLAALARTAGWRTAPALTAACGFASLAYFPLGTAFGVWWLAKVRPAEAAAATA